MRRATAAVCAATALLASVVLAVSAFAATKTGSFSKKPAKPGTYKLYCTIHGSKQSLTIKVR